MIGDNRADLWWSLDDDHSSDAAGEALVLHVLPWLDRFPDKLSILDAYDQAGSVGIGLSPAGALDIADLCSGLRLAAKERRILRALRTPAHIQQFLDELPYDEKGGASSPRVVLRNNKAQCYSGALFACAALRELGYAPRIMWIDPVADDGHCLALYESGGLWGSVAKSNFTTIRSREPVYPYLALGLSYFDGYFNSSGKRTMRAFTVPIELEPFEPRGWRFGEDKLLYIDRAIDTAPRAWKLPRRSVKQVSPVSETIREAGMLGVNPEGLWKP
jgi:hypothetical protein